MTKDTDTIRQLEKKLERKLSQLDEIDFDQPQNGYVIDRQGNISGLSLYYTEITDISPLQGLTNLTDLHLSANKITDLSPLQGLTDLTRLDLSLNRITAISSPTA